MEAGLKEKLTKIYKLVKRGVEGEKENAELLLNRLLQKHRLFREPTKDDYKNRKPLTREEKQAIWRMSAIKETLSNKTYIKKIQ